MEKEQNEEDINAKDALNEDDMPERVPNTENLPQLNKIDLPEDLKEAEDKANKKRDGMDKAMKILDEYYEDTPVRDNRFDHSGE